jgi:hypothetical protein
MVHFKQKIPNLGEFGSVLQWKMLVYYMVIGSIIQIFGIFYGPLVPFWSFSRFGILYEEKSGNPVADDDRIFVPMNCRFSFLPRTSTFFSAAKKYSTPSRRNRPERVRTRPRRRKCVRTHVCTAEGSDGRGQRTFRAKWRSEVRETFTAASNPSQFRLDSQSWRGSALSPETRDPSELRKDAKFVI